MRCRRCDVAVGLARGIPRDGVGQLEMAVSGECQSQHWRNCAVPGADWEGVRKVRAGGVSPEVWAHPMPGWQPRQPGSHSGCGHRKAIRSNVGTASALWPWRIFACR